LPWAGDGTIRRPEFVARYAREDAAIQADLRRNWFHLMQIMHNENKKGMKAMPPVSHACNCRQRRLAPDLRRA
jgi:hypothetical protein